MTDQEKTAISPNAVPDALFQGSCACNRITYAVTAMPGTVQCCHCVSCRKLSGGPYQAFADVDSKSVQLSDNHEHLKFEGFPRDNMGGIEYLCLSSLGERAFCVSCHTPLGMRYRTHPDTIGVTLGSINIDSVVNDKIRSALKPQEHIFVSQQAFWYDITHDGLPMNERFSEELQKTYPGLDKALQSEKSS